MKRSLYFISVLLFSMFQSLRALACACGCGVFDVGTSAMFPNSSGGMVFLDYDYLDQNHNWSGNSSASGTDLADKHLRTHIVTAGGHYVWDRSWGTTIEVPFSFRYFLTTDPNTGGPSSVNHAGLGDIRVKAVYTGISEAMTTGLSFGTKLPTGGSTFSGFDPDTEIGTGSTDLLLGVYHLGYFSNDDVWGWVGQLNLELPVLTKNGYLPGDEIDAAYGAYYNGWSFLEGSLRLAPMLQLDTRIRASDHGGNASADPVNTGYKRVYVAPAFELDSGKVRFYGSVEFPVFQYMDGDQLVAPRLYKTAVSYMF